MILWTTQYLWQLLLSVRREGGACTPDIGGVSLWLNIDSWPWFHHCHYILIVEPSSCTFEWLDPLKISHWLWVYRILPTEHVNSAELLSCRMGLTLAHEPQSLRSSARPNWRVTTERILSPKGSTALDMTADGQNMKVAKSHAGGVLPTVLRCFHFTLQHLGSRMPQHSQVMKGCEHVNVIRYSWSHNCRIWHTIAEVPLHILMLITMYLSRPQ